MIIKPGLFGYANTDAKRDDFDSRNQLLLEKAKQIDIVLMGDSITEALQAKQISQNLTIVNSGIGGDRACYMRNRFIADALQLQPKKIVLLAGVNDLHAWLDNDAYEGLTQTLFVETVMKYLQEMVDKSLDEGIETYIGTILPINRPQERAINNTLGNETIRLLNKEIEKLTKDKAVQCIDYYTAFVKDEKMDMQFSEDGLHPNVKGQNLMIELIRYALDITA